MLKKELENLISCFINDYGKIISFHALSGGDINELTFLHCQKANLVLKSGHHLDNMYIKEAKGLALLKSVGLPIPEVVLANEKFLLMKALEQGRGSAKSQEQAGRQLALAHQKEQSTFGLDHDNFIGSLIQKNMVSSDWINFYREYRIGFQLGLLKKSNSISVEHQKIWQKLLGRFEKILDHQPFASLLHGDLWSGNIYWSADGAVFIDPAVYYGDRYVDLAFSEMFGGFSKIFYDAYLEVFGKEHNDKKYQELKSFYQIYPLLVHANLFGSGYYRQAFALAQKYI